MVRISGKVISSRKRKPLAGVTVSIAGKSTTTGPGGTFSVDVPKGTYFLRAMKTGYESF